MSETRSKRALPAAIARRFRALGMPAPDHYVYVNIKRQELRLVRGGRCERAYPISTSAFGEGNRAGSNQTPRGIHRIREKIGAGAPLCRIFRSRQDTGVDWQGTDEPENLILTRILRLEGLEDGVNRGPGIDSYERFIYIHGTNREDRVGTPLSHGCVVMRNADVIDLFDRVEGGTLVIID
jgi:UDP-N-acetylmuramate--alanine ligase